MPHLFVSRRKLSPRKIITPSRAYPQPSASKPPPGTNKLPRKLPSSDTTWREPREDTFSRTEASSSRPLSRRLRFLLPRMGAHFQGAGCRRRNVVGGGGEGGRMLLDFSNHVLTPYPQPGEARSLSVSLRHALHSPVSSVLDQYPIRGPGP